LQATVKLLPVDSLICLPFWLGQREGGGLSAESSTATWLFVRGVGAVTLLFSQQWPSWKTEAAHPLVSSHQATQSPKLASALFARSPPGRSALQKTVNVRPLVSLITCPLGPGQKTGPVGSMELRTAVLAPETATAGCSDFFR
jgi:hypothetical protein